MYLPLPNKKLPCFRFTLPQKDNMLQAKGTCDQYQFACLSFLVFLEKKENLVWVGDDILIIYIL